jgi:ribosomal subunit interface protein
MGQSGKKQCANTDASEALPAQFRLMEAKMKIQIRGRNVELTKVLRARAERRLGFALSRFGERIGQVLLRFSDTNGPRGDIDKRCQIDVGLKPKSVRVEHTDADLFLALDRAADRASRSVARALEREREWEESPPPTARHRRVSR